MHSSVFKADRWSRLSQFIKYCLVGASGVAVDMTILYVLADPRMLEWSVTVSKVCAAETAMLNNFLWNEMWTFRSAVKRGQGGVLRRLLCFNAICGIGIALAVFFLHVFHAWLGFNLYVANSSQSSWLRSGTFG